MKYIFIAIILLLNPLLGKAQIFTQQKAEKALLTYRDNLALLRKDHPNKFTLPAVSFFLFGMGNRTKILYKNGMVIDIKTGRTIRKWRIKSEIIVPSEYLVHLELTNGKSLDIQENEEGVYVHENNLQLVLSESPLKLPSFSDKKFGSILAVLHHEVLMNIDEGLPLPNFLVYQKPWYKSASMMTMVLKETGNIALVTPWILNLNEPFDRNNQKMADVDNLGQALYMISTVSDRRHPLVEKILEEADGYKNNKHLEGKTDYAFHPVYQTKWLKFGLRALGISDGFELPMLYDSYSPLMWIDYKLENVGGLQLEESMGSNSPYMLWAEDHFYNQKRGFLGNADYPLSWESNAPDANYEEMTRIDAKYTETKTSATHGWHAAEMFLLIKML